MDIFGNRIDRIEVTVPSRGGNEFGTFGFQLHVPEDNGRKGLAVRHIDVCHPLGGIETCLLHLVVADDVATDLLDCRDGPLIILISAEGYCDGGAEVQNGWKGFDRGRFFTVLDGNKGRDPMSAVSSR